MLIDISRCLGQDDVTYPGDPPVVLSQSTLPPEAGGYSLTRISASVHSGTHIDAPAHFIPTGQKIDELPISRFSLTAHVLQVNNIHIIEPRHLDLTAVQAGDAVLFKTDNGNLPRDVYRTVFASISKELACQLVRLGVELVGIDYLTIEDDSDVQYPIHRELLGAGVLLLEDINLAAVEPGRYHLYCFPLKLAGTEAAPCRAVLETLL